jgi:hypothetical protein
MIQEVHMCKCVTVVMDSSNATFPICDFSTTKIATAPSSVVCLPTCVCDANVYGQHSLPASCLLADTASY